MASPGSGNQSAGSSFAGSPTGPVWFTHTCRWRRRVRRRRSLRRCGPVPKPGEISLAHHEVLSLDELPEFKREVLEAREVRLTDFAFHVAPFLVVPWPRRWAAP
jgi:magnesium chelatase subunit ChlI-like protein